MTRDVHKTIGRSWVIPRRLCVTSLVICFFVILSIAPAQTAIHRWTGDKGGLGYPVELAGDVNSDGFPDLIVGAPGADNNFVDSGNVKIYSGKDGSVIYSLDGTSAGLHFGLSASGAGDVDKDGVPDFLVGTTFSKNIGSVWLYSGKDASLIKMLDGSNLGDGFGNDVAGAGDINADGFDDFLIGIPFSDNVGLESGSALAVSGKDCSKLYFFNGDSSDDYFGLAVAGLGDLNADGFDEFLIGAFQDDVNGSSSGSAKVYSGADGSVLYWKTGDGPGDIFGTNLDGAGDVNADGVPDFIVGAPESLDDCSRGYGYARVFSGKNGAELYTFRGAGNNDLLGAAVSGAGDVNQDGFDDVIVGAQEPYGDWCPEGYGYADLYSGRTGNLLYRFAGPNEGSYLGTALSEAGDVNSDGLDDFLVGCPGEIIDPKNQYYGSAMVYSGNDLFLNAWPKRAAVGETVTLTTADGEPGTLVAMFIVAVNGTAVTYLQDVGVFGLDRRFVVSGVVPPGTGGIEVEAQSFSLAPAGQVIDTAREVVTIQ